MKAAVWPPARAEEQRLLVIDRERGTLADQSIAALPGLVRPGDVWVLNDAATLPASLAGRVRDRDVELRLAGRGEGSRFTGVLFGEGSWRDDTDHRPAPPVLEVGEVISLGPPLQARVLAVDPRTPRLIEIDLEPGGDRFWSLLYRLGKPVQYSYLREELSLSQVQTPYASRPWAVELPSAGRPLSAAIMTGLRACGAQLVTLTHAAGLSATGDATLDALLPLPERYEIPEPTARAIHDARRRGDRIVAVGTSAARALEGSFATYRELHAGSGITDLRLGPAHRLAVVDALLTGAHDPMSSHYQLLRAFVPDALLARAVAHSEGEGYLGHEFGDSWLAI